MTELAPIILALAVLVPALAAAYNAVRKLPEKVAERVAATVAATVAETVLPPIQEIADEVRTFNNLTMGEKSDADESRRIDEIPEAERTVDEAEHLRVIDVNGSPGAQG